MTTGLDKLVQNPINKDVIASPETYRALGSGNLLVTSIFYTLQGEGPYMGTPAVFVRLAGCNRGTKDIGCEFCDTDFRISRSATLSVDEVVAQIAITPKGDCSLVVITGGEPMLQPGLGELIRALTRRNIIVQIESNGDFYKDVGEAMLVVSPKVRRDGGYGPIKHEVRDRLDCLKILVDAREGSPYHILPWYFSEVQKSKVMISPLTVYLAPPPPGRPASVWGPEIDQASTARNIEYAAKLCLMHGVRLSLQMHTFCSLY